MLSKFMTFIDFYMNNKSPVIMRKLWPPLLAGESTFCSENLPPVVYPFTYNALPYIDCKKQEKNKQ